MIMDGNLSAYSLVQAEINSTVLASSSEVHSQEDRDFSDVVLNYISQMLMEEDMDEETFTFQESAALQAKEKSFYEVLGEKYPLQDEHWIGNFDQNAESPDGNYVENRRSYNNCGHINIKDLVGPDWNYDLSQNEATHLKSDVSQPHSQSSFCYSACNCKVMDGLVDSPISTLVLPYTYSDGQPVLGCRLGVEDTSIFISNGDVFSHELEHGGWKKQKERTKAVVVELEKQYDDENPLNGSRGKKIPHPSDFDLEEGRSNKHSTLHAESTVRSEMFDMVLLYSGGENDSALREALRNTASKSIQENDQSKDSNGGKARRKRQGGKKNVVDLRALLILCAQAVAANDQRTANEFLKQIREHSSPTGDGMQRLAYYFADGLEARVAGFGTQIYNDVINMPTSAADVLKAYHLYSACCPFRKISNFFSNMTIMKVAENATRLHIVDFGTLYGFQWPSLIQRLSSRPGGPPKLRITGIDFPNPGFRPSKRVEETGNRLANYASTFKVPFEFHAIAQKWETIQVEDLMLDKDEVLVVNSIYRFRYLLDETVMVHSPRNMVLDLIRKLNPVLCIQGIANGAYNTPFFTTRFREALFHYSSIFDMFEANIPREIHERMLLEKTIFGREAMNVIACEGAERVERPETYKQWHVRNLRAGFRQLPLNEDIVKMATDRVKSCYHKDYVVYEEGHWLLQGWKGRILYALSTWTPAY